MTQATFIRPRDGDDYEIVGVRDDGSEYTWMAGTLAEMLILALNTAEEYDRKAAEAKCRADEYRQAFKDARATAPKTDRIEQYRKLVVGRLDWAAHWLVTPHTRRDTWPTGHADAIPLVREKVELCTHEHLLQRWAMICERMHDDWAARLMVATGVIESET